MQANREIIREAVQTAIAQHKDQRVIRTEIKGKTYFIKRRIRGRNSFLKGSGELTFLRELHKINIVNERIDLAPHIVDYGLDYFVLQSAGQALNDIHNDTEDQDYVFELAGHYLAQLHGQGLYHGRPAIRDICYDPATEHITFIDWENKEHTSTYIAPAEVDLFLFIHSFFREHYDRPSYVKSALRGYCSTEGGMEIFQSLQLEIKRHNILLAIANALLRFDMADINAFADTCIFLLDRTYRHSASKSNT